MSEQSLAQQLDDGACPQDQAVRLPDHVSIDGLQEDVPVPLQDLADGQDTAVALLAAIATEPPCSVVASQPGQAAV
jgi:hypothetical protein